MDYLAGKCECGAVRSSPSVISSWSRLIPANALNAEPVEAPAGSAVAVQRVLDVRNATQGSAYVHVALGSLVDAPSIRPTAHIWVSRKAPWFEITDELPQFDELPT
jgi:hypothetical protein